MKTPSFIEKKRVLFMSFTLALLTFLLYLPVRQAQFLVYDDKGYILDNGFILLSALDFIHS